MDYLLWITDYESLIMDHWLLIMDHGLLIMDQWLWIIEYGLPINWLWITDYGLLIMDHSEKRVSERGVWKVDLASLFFFANVPREPFSKAFSTDGFRSAQDFMSCSKTQK
mgnify:CR=1 FL=1